MTPYSSTLSYLISLWLIPCAHILWMYQALQMELKPFGVLVSVCYPPDTDTPGYKEGVYTYLSCFLLS